MHRNNLLQQLQKYRNSKLITEHELPMLDRLEQFIATNLNCFDRANSGHITSSVWLVNHEQTHALLTHHKKFNLWVQLGGHNDSDTDCKAVALKEAEEESGISGFSFLHDDIFDIDIHPIPGKCPYHYDIRYLLKAPEDAILIVSDESHDLAWVPFEQISQQTLFASVLRMNEKFKRYFLK